METEEDRSRFVLCIETRDCEDLERGKVYRVIPDTVAADDDFIRIVDESGEDYLYPESYFVDVKIPRKAETALTNTQ